MGASRSDPCTTAEARNGSVLPELQRLAIGDSNSASLHYRRGSGMRGMGTKGSPKSPSYRIEIQASIVTGDDSHQRNVSWPHGAIYGRVSTDDKGQDPENQLRQLRA